MPDVSNGRREEDRRHPAHTLDHAVVAQGAEVHALLEEEDLAHGPHLGAADGRGETMKRSLFQGDA